MLSEQTDCRESACEATIQAEHSCWTFLTNHSHVLICLARETDMRLRDVALEVGITERAVQKIVQELEAAGYLTRHREGRRNHYELHPSLPLRHSVEGSQSVAELLKMADAFPPEHYS